MIKNFAINLTACLVAKFLNGIVWYYGFIPENLVYLKILCLGDLLKRENMLDLVRKAGEMSESGSVHLVTADGSVDCQSDPGRQVSC